MDLEKAIKNKKRIRSIRNALAEIKTADPSTAITYHYIRKLCDSKAITHLMAGKKILINLDELLNYLNMEVA